MRIFERLRAQRQSGDESSPATHAGQPIALNEPALEQDHCCGGCGGQSHGVPSRGEH